MYCTSDSQLALNGLSAYTWVIIYFFLITFEMTYGKKLTSAVKMESVCGPVFFAHPQSRVIAFHLRRSQGLAIRRPHKRAEESVLSAGQQAKLGGISHQGDTLAATHLPAAH